MVLCRLGTIEAPAAARTRGGMFVQVGEFYETMGTDAVLLVQHAGLNPMGQGDPPRAGCPVANLRRTISDLVEQAGLSVVSLLPQSCKPLGHVMLGCATCLSVLLLTVHQYGYERGLWGRV